MDTNFIVGCVAAVLGIGIVVAGIAWGTVVSMEKTAQFQQTCFAEGGNPVRINGSNVCIPVPVGN